jgi:pimeloyl-ACP methyl ester carboxylesterase
MGTEPHAMETLDVRGTILDVYMAGSGPPLVYLHAEQFYDRSLPHLEALSARRLVIAPRHPYFGPRPADVRTVDDLAYLYLDMLERLDLRDAVLVGASFGGWIALEMCVRSLARIRKLVLVSSVGVKLSDREARDFADLFYLPDSEAFPALFADPARFAPRYGEMAQTEVEAIARERQATAFYGWRPYLHNPGLARWLHRVDLPTLVLWGEKDGFASPAYGRKLAERLPKAEFRLVSGAGHYPHIEQSAAVAEAIDAFAR